MTRKELEQEAAEARRRAFDLDRQLEHYRKADAVRNTTNVLTINNTTIAWTGNGGITDPDLVVAVRAFIADKLEQMEPR